MVEPNSKKKAIMKIPEKLLISKWFNNDFLPAYLNIIGGPYCIGGLSTWSNISKYHKLKKKTKTKTKKKHGLKHLG